MYLEIPYGDTIIDIDVYYDTVATGGPPDGDYDVVITSWRFLERWKYIVEDGRVSTAILDSAEEHLTLVDGEDFEVCTPYDDYIADWLTTNANSVRERCQYELDNPPAYGII